MNKQKKTKESDSGNIQENLLTEQQEDDNLDLNQIKAMPGTLICSLKTFFCTTKEYFPSNFPKFVTRWDIVSILFPQGNLSKYKKITNFLLVKKDDMDPNYYNFANQNKNLYKIPFIKQGSDIVSITSKSAFLRSFSDVQVVCLF